MFKMFRRSISFHNSVLLRQFGVMGAFIAGFTAQLCPVSPHACWPAKSYQNEGIYWEESQRVMGYLQHPRPFYLAVLNPNDPGVVSNYAARKGSGSPGSPCISVVLMALLRCKICFRL